MSREDFRSFVKTLEHNLLLKERLVKCKTSKDLIKLAKELGYIISLEDLDYDKTATKAQSWFVESKISILNNKNKI